MVSLQSYGGKINLPNYMEIYGLSTDTKPTETFENHEIANSSMFYEMDTKKVFMYDADGIRWLAQN